MPMPTLIYDFMLPFCGRSKFCSFISAHVAVCQGQIRVHGPVQAGFTAWRLQYQQGDVRTYELFTKLVRFGSDSCTCLVNFASMNVVVYNVQKQERNVSFGSLIHYSMAVYLLRLRMEGSRKYVDLSSRGKSTKGYLRSCGLGGEWRPLTVQELPLYETSQWASDFSHSKKKE